jgi:hypothetical protein
MVPGGVAVGGVAVGGGAATGMAPGGVAVGGVAVGFAVGFAVGGLELFEPMEGPGKLVGGAFEVGGLAVGALPEFAPASGLVEPEPVPPLVASVAEAGLFPRASISEVADGVSALGSGAASGLTMGSAGAAVGAGASVGAEVGAGAGAGVSGAGAGAGFAATAGAGPAPDDGAGPLAAWLSESGSGISLPPQPTHNRHTPARPRWAIRVFQGFIGSWSFSRMAKEGGAPGRPEAERKGDRWRRVLARAQLIMTHRP